MAKIASAQLTLKPQDLFVLLALLTHPGESMTYPDLAARTGLAASAVHASIKRAIAAGLAIHRDGSPVVLRPQLREFVLHGAKYAFPAIPGRIARGVATSYAAPPLDREIAPSADPVPVWPHRNGNTRGVTLAPLYPSVPEAALRDRALYELLALFDALRAGQARERALAQKLLEKRLQ